MLAEDREQACKFPTPTHRLIFQTWKVDFYILTPFEFEVTKDTILLIVRTGHHIFKWEYLRRGSGWG